MEERTYFIAKLFESYITLIFSIISLFISWMAIDCNQTNYYVNSMIYFMVTAMMLFYLFLFRTIHLSYYLRNPLDAYHWEDTKYICIYVVKAAWLIFNIATIHSRYDSICNVSIEWVICNEICTLIIVFIDSVYSYNRHIEPNEIV